MEKPANCWVNHHLNKPGVPPKDDLASAYSQSMPFLYDEINQKAGCTC